MDQRDSRSEHSALLPSSLGLRTQQPALEEVSWFLFQGTGAPRSSEDLEGPNNDLFDRAHGNSTRPLEAWLVKEHVSPERN